MKLRVAAITIFVSAGAVANVAVAWACALWSVAEALYLIEPDYSSGISEAELRWFRQNGWFPQVDQEVKSGALSGIGFQRHEYFLLHRLPANARGRGMGLSGGQGHAAFLRQTFAGWPFHSLYCEEWMLDKKQVLQRFADGSAWKTQAYEPRYAFYHGVSVDPFRAGPLALPRSVPLLPIWPAFIANTLFYAAILWLLAWVPRALVRLIRRRRGLCPACAYPIGEAVICRKCGKVLRRPAVA